MTDSKTTEIVCIIDRIAHDLMTDGSSPFDVGYNAGVKSMKERVAYFVIGEPLFKDNRFVSMILEYVSILKSQLKTVSTF